MREQLVAWAGDCRVYGTIEVGDGRLSDQVNGIDLLVFSNATLKALDDGHEVELDELEVERRELHLIEVAGHRGDPARRQRTVMDRVRLELGPYQVVGYMHRSPVAYPLAPLAGITKFLPITDALVMIDGNPQPVTADVVLVNRERVGRSEVIDLPPLS